MKTKKKIVSLLFAFFFILGIMPMTAMAENEMESWVDYAAESFAGGSGTKNDPYQIATAEQLAKLAKEVNSGVPDKTHNKEYFKLTAPIDLSGKKWTPIGCGNAVRYSFSGYFDGNNQKITGLYVDERGKDSCAGLFGCVDAATNEVVLKNFVIEGATIYAGNATDDAEVQYGAGVLVGSATVEGGNSVQYVGIENCSVSGTVDSKMYAGGLIGAASYAQISNCTADVAVTGNTCGGGFAGYSFNSTFSNNSAKGNVTSTGWCTGGFVGYCCNGSITECTASGNVTAADWNLGGFAGYFVKDTYGTTGATAEIKNCIATGDVTSTVSSWNPKAGGFVGTNYEGNIQNSYAIGTVTGSNTYGTAGGFIGSDEAGTTVSCSFDKTKNPELNGIGGTVTAGTNDITGKETADICNDYYGGHDYSKEWTIDKEATCLEEGSKSHHCVRCGDKTDVTSITKINHALDKTEAKQATHLTEGNIAYWQCSSCKKYFSDAAGTKEISLADTVIAKITTHKEDGTGWHSDKSNHWKTCECGEVLNKAAHTKKTTVTKKATLTANGKSVTKCTTCGKTLTNTTIPKVSKVTLSSTSYTYNGKVKKPSVTVKDSKGTILKNGTDYKITYAKGRKNVGKYTVKITLKGMNYSGTKTLTFTIKPKGTSLTSKGGQKKAFTVKWKKQTTQTSGYQIQYATKKNFSNAKTVTVKKNSTTKQKITGCSSNKKYYVRIRTYKNVKVNGKTTKIASDWSEYTTVKTK